ncbi:hypothetical protein N7495_007668 [Penicillium taxi]|uniref:uncharacterized protein n=1 Tax=Penicillium taxi TaxID=168475 RepID=UPI00254581DD|nr:uncharacterized protein N7495_007668 [Penicillium taxi]KAJ5887627.1 hypothetical protein N7495_007668 [Penicillium taxi]
MLISSLVAVSLAVLPTAVSAYSITGDTMNCYSGPGTSYSVIKTYKNSDSVSITYQALGTEIKGDSIWDKTSDGCYVANYYVKTGSSTYVTKKRESSSSGSGSAIVEAADKEKGIPYAKGGGGCNGPSRGGFDSSGLTQYSICKALKKTIPRTAQTQYDAINMGTRIPRSEAKVGDLLFWGENGNCKTGVSHVGIFIRDGWMINAVHAGSTVRNQAIWTSHGSERICNYVMRFW